MKDEQPQILDACTN